MALWRVEEAAEYLGIRPKTLYEWVRTGRVPHRKLGFNVRFDPTELAEWVEGQSAGAGSSEAAESATSGQGPDLSPLLEAARQAARQLRRVETDLGTQLSFPQRQQLRDLAERLDDAARDVSGE